MALRRQELKDSCAVLGVSDLELLDYHDSGMEGWAENTAEGAFWNTPVPEAAARLAALMDHYQPQVVVTYDENGFYGHPDHIQANRITLEAMKLSSAPKKLYYTAVPRSALKDFAARLREMGVDPPEAMDEDPTFGTPDELITTQIDCNDFAPTKFQALAAHASQSENIFFLKMSPEVFKEAFGRESFVRVVDSTGAPTPESDLFAGLR